MKFLAFTDLHADKRILKILVARAATNDINFVLCCGDFTVFGRGMKDVFAAFEKTGKPLYLIPGNHEEGRMSLIGRYTNCINIDRKAVGIGNYLFLGYGGGGFSVQDAEFRKISREWYGKHKGKKLVFVTHMPAYGTKIDKLEHGHVGNKDYRRFIDRIKPKLAISGHLHETVGMIDTLGPTKLVNPGWDGMVIELK